MAYLKSNIGRYHFKSCLSFLLIWSFSSLTMLETSTDSPRRPRMDVDDRMGAKMRPQKICRSNKAQKNRGQGCPSLFLAIKLYSFFFISGVFDVYSSSNSLISILPIEKLYCVQLRRYVLFKKSHYANGFLKLDTFFVLFFKSGIWY